MSLIPPGMTQGLPFYLSGPLPCPYLPAQVERKLFTRLDGAQADNTAINAALCRAGFRRSHDVVYRPACDSCNACVPVRIPVALFTPSRSLRRVAAHNRDLRWQQIDRTATDEVFGLFCAYQNQRHGDSEMAQMTRDDFAMMLDEGQAGTLLYALRDGDSVLKGCMIADPVGDGLSAVYSFFAPDAPQRSLGTALVLGLIAEAAAQKLPHVYLGYWIAASRKMAYKARFKPLQCLTAQGWSFVATEQEG